MGILDEAASPPALRAALDLALRRRGAPGADGMTAAEFAARGPRELDVLREELLAGQYRPRPARRVVIPKPGGGHRLLAIGNVRDRVVQHAVASCLSAHVDGQLHPFAYAYRRGRSTRHALEAVEVLLRGGRSWILRGDIESFFDTLSPPLLLGRLEEATKEPALVALVEQFLSAGTLVGGEIADADRGTPQGSPLSPVLANLYLTPFDRAVAAAGFEMVRYGDDFLVATHHRAEAERALVVVREALARLQLRLNASKVEIRHFGEGFTFLGFRFSPQGRRPGRKALRRLEESLAQLAQEQPQEWESEARQLLRGWLDYYGALADVRVPEGLRSTAESIEAERAQRAQVGPIDGRSPVEVRQDPPVPGASVGTMNPWQVAARRLAGTTDETFATVSEQTRKDLDLSETEWPPLAAALRRGDGAEASEQLARLGRFGDAERAAAVEAPSTRPVDAQAPAREPSGDTEEQPRFQPTRHDAERLLDLFGGAEHVFLREVRRDDGTVLVERVLEPLTVEHAERHLRGAWRLGSFPLRANNSSRFAAVKVSRSAKARKGKRPSPADVTREVRAHTLALLRAAGHLGLTAVASIEPVRGFVVWLLFNPAQQGGRSRALLRRVCDTAGAPAPGVTRELIPAQDVAKREKPGTGILWPLGVDVRSGRRCWFYDQALQLVLDPTDFLRTIEPDGAASVAAALGPRAGEAHAARAAADPVAVATSPFHDLPRAQDVYVGCNVLRHFVDKAVRGEGLHPNERYLVADTLARLGAEAEPALDAVLRYLDDYRPDAARRLLARIYPNPTSCGRIRERLPELTARVGCDCRFRLVPGAYPTPALHAVGAADVPGLGDRVRDAAARGGRERAARALMNEHHKEAGAKAVALCARLSDLRRQGRAVARAIANAEEELEALVSTTGDGTLETPSGTLRRVIEGGVRRFVLDV